MKKNDKELLLNKLNLKDYKIKGGLITSLVSDSKKDFHCLKGYLIEDSVFEKNSVFFHWLIQPLYVPFPTLILSFGNRSNLLEKNHLSEFNKLINKWNKDFSVLKNLEDVCLFFSKELERKKEDVYLKKTVAYTSIIMGENYSYVTDLIGQILELKKHKNANWYIDDIKEAEEIYPLLKTKQYNSCIALLKKWQSEMIFNLKCDLPNNLF